MSERTRLSNRRASTQFSFVCNALRYTAVPISEAEAFDGARWTCKQDDLIQQLIDQIGHPDQHLDAIARELAKQIGPDAQLRASLLQRYSQKYLNDCHERSIETARQMVQSFVHRTDHSNQTKQYRRIDQCLTGVKTA